MKSKEWKVELDQLEYRIEFYPSMLFRSVKSLIINNEIIRNVKTKLHQRGADYHFEIAGHVAVIRRKPKGIKAVYELEIDGERIADDEFDQFL